MVRNVAARSSPPLADTASTPRPDRPEAEPKPLEKPLREGKASLELVDGWNAAAGLNPKVQREKNDHARSPGAYSSAFPHVMMHADLAEGPYAVASQLSPGRPSPQATLIGDNHLNNSGSMTLPSGESVYGVADWTKAGQGPIENDLKRLAATSVMLSRRLHHSPQTAKALSRAAADAYFDELAAWRGRPRPAPYLRADELTAKGPIRSLLRSAAKRDAFSHKRGLLASADRFATKYALKQNSPAWQEVSAAFEAFDRQLPPVLQGTLRLLDIASRLPVGGSGSGMRRYYVLADVRTLTGKTERRVFTLKRMVPAPTETVSGDPSQVKPEVLVARGRQLNPSQSPYVGYGHVDGLPYLVSLSSEQELLLDRAKLSAKDLTTAVAETARLTARAHLQSVDPAALDAWLRGLNRADATERLIAFAEVYSQQTQRDVKALEKATRSR